MKKRNLVDYRQMTIMNEYTEIARLIDAAMSLLKVGICDRRGKAYYVSLLDRISGMVISIGDRICKEPDDQTAQRKYGSLLTEVLVKRSVYKRFLMQTALTSSVDVCNGRVSNPKPNVYRLKALIYEFGSAVYSDGGKYDVWSAVPSDRISREKVNDEIEELLKCDWDSAVSYEKLNGSLLKVLGYKHEMNCRIVDCWHILMINEQTERNPERETKAFLCLREALLFHERLAAAGESVRAACKKVAL